MTTVTLSVASREDVTRRALAAFEGEAQGAHISFASVELLWQTLTAKRWEILKAMTGQGPLTIREVARRVERDVKAVHGDIHLWLVERPVPFLGADDHARAHRGEENRNGPRRAERSGADRDYQRRELAGACSRG